MGQAIQLYTFYVYLNCFSKQPNEHLMQQLCYSMLSIGPKPFFMVGFSSIMNILCTDEIEACLENVVLVCEPCLLYLLVTLSVVFSFL